MPFMAGATSASATENRQSFKLYGRCAPFSVACAASLSGWILTKDATGALIGFEKVGYVALGATLFCMVFIGQIRSDQPH